MAPIYQFRCRTNHSHTYEKIQTVKEGEEYLSSEPKCPKCGEPVERIIGATSFKLAGGGWFSDGYR